MTLRVRLFLLVGGVIALTVGLVTWSVSSAARRAFESVDRERAAAQMTQIRREFTRQGQDIASRIERIASSDAFQRTAIEIGRREGDYRSFVNEAAPLAAAQNLDLLDLVADDGTLISSAEWPARFGYKHPWARTHVGPDAFLQPVELPGETTLGLVAVRRVAAGSRVLYVAGGRRLERGFLESLAPPEGMRVLLYRHLEPSRPQLIDASGSVAADASLEPLIARVRDSRREAAASVHGGAGAETVEAIPLTGPDGGVLAVLLLGSSGRELAALVSRIRWTGFALGGAGILIGLALSYVLASRVTRPVEELADAAREIAAGRWEVRPAAAAATAEVASLAGAFDTMTRQLGEQRDRLIQVERVAAWRELARRLAHELKNPLFPLRLTIDNLRRARGLPAAEFEEVLDESLATLDAGLGSLNAVVGRFSDFSKMPAPEFAPVGPNAIVERAVALFRAQAEAADRPPIRVSLDLDPSALSIRADGEQLGRAVQNLLLNAIDAMPRGGDLGIRSRVEAGIYHLAISDTGEGLTAEECTRLFTPYYTTKQHGTGLGLAIVQSVVADHHGKVWVDSAPGRGATFHIELPVEQTAA
jgi:signal transduction histidine kinase